MNAGARPSIAGGEQASVLVVGWDAERVANTSARVAELNSTGRIAHYSPSEQIGGRLAAFRELDRRAVDHVRSARQAGVAPVIVLTGWYPPSASLQDGVTAKQLSPALAILSTPEVLWLFDGLPAVLVGDLPWLAQHSLDALSQPLWNPLYDATGLRQWVRRHLREELAGADRMRDPVERVVALDDEHRYRSLFAYVGYRLNYPCIAPESYAETTRLLGPELGAPQSGARPADRPPIHTIEDIFVFFADQEQGADISRRADRERLLPELSHAVSRKFVTSGDLQAEFAAPNDWILKPIRGLFALQSKLPGLTAGNTPLDHWMCNTDSLPHPDEESNVGRHATNGLKTELAATMVARAEDLLANSSQFHDILLAAVLGLDAQRLLRGRSPTTALEALAVQHQAEITLECVFAGVAPDPAIRGRLRELTKAVTAICSTYGELARARARRAAELEITNRLIKVLGEYGRFEEQTRCMNHARNLRWKVLATGDAGDKVAAVASAYFVYIMISPITLLVGAIGSAVLFTTSYILFLDMDWWTALGRSTITMLSVQPRDEAITLIDYACIVSGLLHFGMLISYIFSVISRR